MAAGCCSIFLMMTTMMMMMIISASSSSSRAEEFSNVLLTGQTLKDQNGLGYPDSKVAFVMQIDCNLVLYNANDEAMFHTNTAGIGYRNCILSFTENGRLQVSALTGRQLWQSSNANSKPGNYAAVLRPDGQVSIYGPAIWSTGAVLGSSNNSGNTLVAKNLLFSGKVLYENDKLSDNGYSFELTTVCDLLLKRSGGEIAWQTWTKGNGQNCFARLNHRGELAILDDNYKSVWSSSRATTDEVVADGEYVLIMQHNGNAVIYGPEVWSTAHRNNGLIRIMPAAQKYTH